MVDPAQRPPPRATSVLVGEGWGCAQFASEAGATWQCWNAPDATKRGSEPIRAWIVPWLKDKSLQNGPDRLCEGARPAALTFRCWHRPVRGETSGRELPASWEWLNPHHAAWGDALSRSDRLGRTYVGGTFACLQETKNDGLWCLGDNSYGQLGGSRPVPPLDAGRDDPAFVAHVWPAESVALGTWHACALASSNGVAGGGYASCWGRGDHGQLGAPAPDLCVVGGATVPCARTPQRGPAFPSMMAVLRAGDLFTCATTRQGIECWGASRDGLFGTPGSCPGSLRRAWPTLGGPVPAPNASCSDTPVAIPGATAFDPGFLVGSRAICFHQTGAVTCAGAIPLPAGGGVRGMAMSTGSDASACALDNQGVVCWGELYSPAGALDTPVPIVFEPPPPITETAVVGASDPSLWAPECLLRRGCTLAPSPIEPCRTDGPHGEGVRDWKEVLAVAPSLFGDTVSVRGLLEIGSIGSTMKGCPRINGQGCCNAASGHVLLAGAAKTLALEGLYCKGDDSAACCNAPAYGQTVVATGRLEGIRVVGDPTASGWILREPSICVERTQAGAP